MSNLTVQPKYRSDIDGLRAIAVLSVVGFHAFPNAIPGGFVGVDIFFVISGFLISTIVFGSLNQGSFGFVDFYARRVKRIFPALILILVTSWIAGWCLLYPLEYGNLGKHIAGGAGFLSNFVLWRDSGYFDTAAELKPLLHLWSLAIEEQFYLVWPLTLVLVWRWRLVKTRLAVISALAVCSFTLSVWTSEREPVVAYYFPITRFWELLVGCFLAYATIFHARLMSNSPSEQSTLSCFAIPRWLTLPDLQATIGLALIAAAIFGIRKDSLFPGWLALLPTFGALLVISAGSRALINRRLLGTRIMVFVGLISYPLYLWHWPLLSFARVIDGGAPPKMVLILLVALSFPLAWLTYKLIERPIRQWPRDSTAIALACAMVGCLVIGIAANHSAIPGRLDTPYTRLIAKAESDWIYPGVNGRPLIVGEGAPEVLFIGDSHMQQYFPRVKRLVDAKVGKTSEFLIQGGCPPLPNVNRLEAGFSCDSFFSKGMRLAIDDPRIRTVVLGGAWENYFLGIPPQKTARGPLLYAAGDSQRKSISIDSPEAALAFAGLAESIKSLRAAGKKVFVLFNNPTSAAYSPSLRYPNRVTLATPQRDTFIKREDFEVFAQSVTQRLETAALEAGAIVINPVDFLCDSSRCATVGPDGAPLYRDSNHLRADFARQAAVYIDQVYF